MANPSPEELIRNGDLEGAMKAVKGQVRSDPATASHRILLFQLMSVDGEWDRALNQLNVLGDLDAKTLSMVQAYREGLRCEALRAEVFAGKRTPLLFGKPESWMAGVLHALQLDAQGHAVKAHEARMAALEEAPATAGRVNGAAFEWIADADSRVGPFLEALVAGRYYWIPFSRLRKVHVEEPADLRDMVWTPVHLTFANGGETVAFVPTRYVGSESHDDANVRLARKTDWRRLGDDGIESYAGIGQRMFATDQADYALLDVRSLELDSPDDHESEMPDSGGLDAELANVADELAKGDGA